MQHGAVGVFDSGVGGLTVVRALREVLPEETLVYLGDTARVPYGTKGAATVERYAHEALKFLECAASELMERRGQSLGPEEGPGRPPPTSPLKLLVVACNTASAVALPRLESVATMPVLGVIEPAARQAARTSRSSKVAVIGTAGTIRSGAYERAFRRIDPGIQVLGRPCPLFVPLAEEGWTDHPVTRLTAKTYLEDISSRGIDTLVLGCTHYPLLSRSIAEAVGEGVSLVDSAYALAEEVDRMLRKRGVEETGQRRGELLCFVTDWPERFRQLSGMFLGEDPDVVEQVNMEEYL